MKDGNRPRDNTTYGFNFRLGKIITDTRLKDSVTLFDDSNQAHRVSLNLLSEWTSFDQKIIQFMYEKFWQNSCTRMEDKYLD